MPIFIMMPDMTADTWLGAAGCASGSHVCRGMKPAFVPKPMTARRKITPPIPPVANLSKSIELFGPPSRKNITSRNAVPMCVATR